MIIGITGTIGAGKGTVVEYLTGQGYTHYSVRSLLTEEILRRGWPVTRDNMFIVANDFRKISPGYVVETMLKRAGAKKENSIIESIRSIGEVETLRKTPGVILLAVDAEPRLRYDRVLLRKSATDNLSYEKFLQEEAQESTSTDPNVANLPACIKRADYILSNNGNKDELFAKVAEILKTINSQG
jgi:dephospho-CoA kinase